MNTGQEFLELNPEKQQSDRALFTTLHTNLAVHCAFKYQSINC